MAQYASRILRLTVEKLQDRRVKEVRFVSGMSPAYMDNDGTHYLELGKLSIERVGEINELCRIVADDPVEDAEATSKYTFFVRHIGRVVCTFRRRDGISSLVVVRDSNALETIAAARPHRPPALRAEAEPDAEKD